MQRTRDEERARQLKVLLAKLSLGTVIVEGKHDAEKLERFGIIALTYPQVSMRVIGNLQKIIYVMVDRDRGGEEKARKLSAMLHEQAPNSKVDWETGRRLLKMLGLTSIEQVYAPITEMLGKADGEKKPKKANFNGKNLFGYSKVHGAG